MARLVIAAALALSLGGCTPFIVRAKCGPDGANDYTPGWAGLPHHISCDGPTKARR